MKHVFVSSDLTLFFPTKFNIHRKLQNGLIVMSLLDRYWNSKEKITHRGFAPLAIQHKKNHNVEKTRSDSKLVLKQKHAKTIELKISIGR